MVVYYTEYIAYQIYSNNKIVQTRHRMKDSCIVAMSRNTNSHTMFGAAKYALEIQFIDLCRLLSRKALMYHYTKF
jgi:hypothetical protein